MPFLLVQNASQTLRKLYFRLTINTSEKGGKVAETEQGGKVISKRFMQSLSGLATGEIIIIPVVQFLHIFRNQRLQKLSLIHI